jgi:hypothetical protein
MSDYMARYPNLIDTEPDRCREVVYVRDTYRYTGRGRSGFELHYTRKRCSRKAKYDGYCWQHRKAV